MLTIRLSKVGKKNRKMFRLIVSEKQRDTLGTSLEIVGSYNPHSKELVAKSDRIIHWLKMGAQMSDTVNNLLIDKKIIPGEKKKVVKITKRRQVKMGKKVEDAKKLAEEKAAKEAAAEEAKKAAEAAPAEAPAAESTEAATESTETVA